jgi:MFS family permease
VTSELLSQPNDGRSDGSRGIYVAASAELRSARLSTMCAFVLHAFVSGSFGPRLPDIKNTTGADTPGLGLGLGSFAAGLLVGTGGAEAALRRFGAPTLIRGATVGLAGTLITLALAGGVASLAAAFFGLGVASGLLDVANNTNAVAVEREYGRPIMSGIHGTWSAGMLAGGGLAAAAAAIRVDPLVHFSLVAVVLISFTLTALRSLPPPGAHESKPTPRTPEPLSNTSGSSAVAVLGLVGFSAFLAEGVAADWSAVYLHETLGATSGYAALGFVTFSLGMTVVRLVADRVSNSVGPVKVVWTGGIVATAGITLALAAGHPGPAVAGFFLFGAGLAPVVPIALSAAGNTRVAGRESLPWVVMISYLGSILGPIAIGFSADLVGLTAALALPAIFGGIIAVVGVSEVGRRALAPGRRLPPSHRSPAEHKLQRARTA